MFYPPIRNEVEYKLHQRVFDKLGAFTWLLVSRRLNFPPEMARMVAEHMWVDKQCDHCTNFTNPNHEMTCKEALWRAEIRNAEVEMFIAMEEKAGRMFRIWK